MQKEQALISALFDKGDMYRNGQGVGEDEIKAAESYKKGANCGELEGGRAQNVCCTKGGRKEQ